MRDLTGYSKHPIVTEQYYNGQGDLYLDADEYAQDCLRGIYQWQAYSGGSVELVLGLEELFRLRDALNEVFPQKDADAFWDSFT